MIYRSFSHIVKHLLTLVCFGFALMLFAARDLELTITPSSPMVGSTAQLKITADASRMAINSLPQVDGIRWSNGVSRSSNMSIVNGRVTSEYTLTCSFMPTKEGNITIPAFRVVVDGVSVDTKPLIVTVRPAPTLRDVQAQPGAEAFAELAIPGVDRGQNVSYYLGEEFPVQFVIYIRDDYELQFREYPTIVPDDEKMMLKYHDFRKENPDSPNFESIVVGRQIIHNYPYRTYTFTTRMRALSVGSFHLRASAQTDIVAQVFNGMSSVFGMDLRSVVDQRRFADAPEGSVTILPLPASPAGMTYIGVMSKSDPVVTLSRQTYRVGDPLTLKISMSDIENAEALTPPTLESRQFRVYPAEVTHQGGAIELNYTMIPLEPGDLKINLPFCIFNPAEKDYRPVVFQQTIHVEAAAGGLKGTSGGAAVVVADPGELADGDDSKKHAELENILYLHDVPASGVILPLYVNHLDLYIFFVALGVVALVVCGAIALRHRMTGNDEGSIRRKNASARRSALLRKLESTDPQNLPDEASAEICSYLNDMLNLAPGTPLNDIAETIRPQSPELSEDLKRLADCTWVPAMKTTLDQAFRGRLVAHLKKLFLFALLLFAFPLFSAEEAAAEKILSEDAAKNAYDSGEFAAALEFYQGKLDRSKPSPDVMYNIGNCYFQQGDYTRALVCYERAHYLNPRDPDIVGNLNLARRKLLLLPKYQVESPSDFFRNLVNFLRADEWAVGIAFAIMLLLFSASLFLLKRSPAGKILLIAGIAILCVCTAALVGKKLTDDMSGAAIVVSKNAPVYSLPSEKSGNVEEYLKPGEEVTIAEVRMDWARIRFGKSGEGWLRTADMLRLLDF